MKNRYSTYQALLCKLLSLDCVVIRSKHNQDQGMALDNKHLEDVVLQETGKCVTFGRDLVQHNVIFTSNPEVLKRPSTKGVFVLDDTHYDTKEESEDALFGMLIYYRLVPETVSDIRYLFEHAYRSRMTRALMLYLLQRQEAAQLSKGEWLFALDFFPGIKSSLSVFDVAPTSVALCFCGQPFNVSVDGGNADTYVCQTEGQNGAVDLCSVVGYDNVIQGASFEEKIKCFVEMIEESGCRYDIVFVFNGSPTSKSSKSSYHNATIDCDWAAFNCTQMALWCADRHAHRSTGGCRICDKEAYCKRHDCHDFTELNPYWLYGSLKAIQNAMHDTSSVHVKSCAQVLKDVL